TSLTHGLYFLTSNDHRDLPTFPTRRSSDLVLLEQKNDLTLANKNQIAQQFTPEIQALKQEIETLQNETNTKEAEVNALYNTYIRSEEHTSELQSRENLVCRLLLEKKKIIQR